MKQIDITCPSCQWQFDILSGLQAAESRNFWHMVLKANLDTNQLALVMRYLVFFKPQKYAISFTALFARTDSLLKLIASGRVERGSNRRVATPEAWYGAVEQW